MSNLDMSVEEAKVKAEAKGLEVRTPTDYELFIDIDSEEQLARHEEMWQILIKNAPYEVLSRTRRESPSGRPGRYHITVNLAKSQPLHMRLALQAALQDDPKRAILTCIRALAGQENPSRFFEKPAPQDAAWKKKYYGI